MSPAELCNSSTVADSHEFTVSRWQAGSFSSGCKCFQYSLFFGHIHALWSSVSFSHLMHGDGTTGQIQHTGGVAICQNYPPPATLNLDVFQHITFYFSLVVLFCFYWISTCRSSGSCSSTLTLHKIVTGSLVPHWQELEPENPCLQELTLKSVYSNIWQEKK